MDGVPVEKVIGHYDEEWEAIQADLAPIFWNIILQEMEDVVESAKSASRTLKSRTQAA